MRICAHLLTRFDMSVTVRAATSDDLATLFALEQAAFQDAWSEGALRSHMETDGAYATLAILDGEVVGYLLGNCLPPIGGVREGELYRIAVLEAARGRGIGRTLLSSFLSALDICFLEVRDGNTAAISLYESAGFALCTIRPRYYKNPTEDARIYRYERQE